MPLPRHVEIGTVSLPTYRRAAVTSIVFGAQSLAAEAKGLGSQQPPNVRNEVQGHSMYTQGDNDVVSFQLVFAAILWVKLLEMFVTLMSLKYSRS